MKNQKSFYLGLDIGTDSVGYATTDEKYNLLKFRGEPAWGVTIFDEASLQTERRSFRSARRRLDRRQQRVTLVQELFAPEIGKIDPRFYIRIKESNLYRTGENDAFTLFNDTGFTDKEYYEKIRFLNFRETVFGRSSFLVKMRFIQLKVSFVQSRLICFERRILSLLRRVLKEVIQPIPVRLVATVTKETTQMLNTLLQTG